VADVPTPLLSALDTRHPAEPEDYTHWEIDDHTHNRLKKIEQEDTGTWDLRGDQ
jgi:hypothetical protein